MEQYLSRRESSWRPSRYTGDENKLMRQIYSSIRMFNSYHSNCTPRKAGQDTGAIFNLEFNGDGNIVVAATERKCVLGFDAITQKEVFKVSDAHTDCVNCVKFFDDRLFATGSDDFTVALWDLRNMKQKMRVLNGHSNWVKNIEYSSKEKLLVTSGFDGSIFTWDIKSQTEQGLISQRVFHASGLMRSRISPDGEKLILCTSSGYIMIIHHLDLTTLHKDLCGFRPGIYRLMQLGDQYIPQAAKYDHVFSKQQKKNRVELVTDFPEQNDAEMIMALQIHPHCRCMITRNVSSDEQSEWTCIHDINEEPDPIDEDDTDSEEEPLTKKKRTLLPHARNSRSDDPTQQRGRYFYPRVVNGTMSLVSSRADSFIPDIWAAEVTVQERAIRHRRARSSASHVSSYNFVYAISSGVLPLRYSSASRLLRDNGNATGSGNSNGSGNGSGNGSDSGSGSVSGGGNSNNSGSGAGNGSTSIRFINDNLSHTILVNAKKLLFYASETNNKPGFIKEPGFSADGRIICSPYANGVRLLGYDSDCSAYPSPMIVEGYKQSPRQLVELANIIEHQDVVLCAKFSPREPLLVTGCNGGEVAWYRPCL